jgi:hypothetical protein
MPVFDAKAAFLRLSGQRFTYKELRKKLDQIRAESIQDLPAEFGTSELFRVAERNNWLRPTPGGELIAVVVGNEIHPAHFLRIVEQERNP